MEHSRESNKEWRSNMAQELQKLHAEGDSLLYAEPFILSYEEVQGLVNEQMRVEEFLRNTLLDENQRENIIGSSPEFFGVKLGKASIDEQLFERLRNGERLPLVYDLLITEEGPRIIEIQVGMGYPAYADLMKNIYKTFYPDVEFVYGENPLIILKEFGRKWRDTYGGTITVLDANPWSNPVEQVNMSIMLNSDSSILPVPLHCVKKDEEGFYYHPYVVDEAGNLSDGKPPAAERSMEDVLSLKCDTSKKIRITNPLVRSVQGDLDLVQNLIEEGRIDKETEKVLLNFFLDEGLNWVWHPRWQTLVDKKTMAKLQKMGFESPHFARMWDAGDKIVGPGRFRIKPYRGVSGKGQKIIELAEGESYIVPDQFIAQEELEVAKIPFNLSEYPISEEKKARLKEFCEEHDFDLCSFPGVVELRLAPPLGNSNEHYGLHLMARIAPYPSGFNWKEGDSPTQTNYGSIERACKEFFGWPQGIDIKPFGWGLFGWKKN